MQNISEFIETEIKLLPEEELTTLFEKFKELYFKKQSFESIKQLSALSLFNAFTHKSFSHENKKIEFNNERLEFLGDSVLQLYITEKLIELHPQIDEGKLSKLRSSIVNENSLNELALHIKLNEFLLVGKGERKEAGFMKTSLLSDCFEALVGAIFTELKMPGAKSFLNELFSHEKFQNLFELKELDSFDYKSNLQELIMKKFKVTPTYKVDEIEVDKQKHFQISFWVGESELLSIEDISKKKGMQKLAKKIIEQKLYEEVKNVN